MILPVLYLLKLLELSLLLPELHVEARPEHEINFSGGLIKSNFNMFYQWFMFNIHVNVENITWA